MNQEKDNIMLAEGKPVNGAIRLASGVEFTAEELELNPILKEKVLKLKEAEANIQTAYQREKSANAELLRKMEEKKAETITAPKAGQDNNEKIIQYTLRKMTEEEFVKAKKQAAKKFGDDITNLIEEKLSKTFIELIESGRQDAAFGMMFDNGFSTLLVEQPQIAQKFAEFKGVITPAQAQENAVAEAKQKLILESLEGQTTTGLPSGGTPIVSRPTNMTHASTLKGASARARARIEEYRNR